MLDVKPFDREDDNEWLGTSEEEIRKYAERTYSIIKVFGLGGAGSNSITRLYKAKIPDIELIACNTDANHLLRMKANNKILLGENLTNGQGAGGDPKIGEEAARESEREIHEMMRGAEIVFVTAGLGGGTGTGSAHYVARMAKEQGILTIAIVTMPFSSEGPDRITKAKIGLSKLAKSCDSLILIENDKLLTYAADLPLEKAFKFADEIVVKAVRAITEITRMTGHINLDINDLKEVMRNSGGALIGIGTSDAPAEERIKEAVKMALNSPFFESKISDATGVLIDVRGGSDLQNDEAYLASSEIAKSVSNSAKIFLGLDIDPSYTGRVQVIVILTGIYSVEDLEPAEDDRGIDSIR